MQEFFAFEIRKATASEKILLMLKRRYMLDGKMNESVYAMTELEDNNQVFNFPLNKWVNIRVKVQGTQIWAFGGIDGKQKKQLLKAVMSGPDASIPYDMGGVAVGTWGCNGIAFDGIRTQPVYIPP